MSAAVSSAAATTSVAAVSSVAATSAAAVISSAAATSAGAAASTSQSVAAASTAATSAATVVAAAASTSSAASTSKSSSAAASSSAASSSAASSSATSSAASSSFVSSSSRASSTSASTTASAAIANASSATTSTSTGLSGGAIGGIAGGVVGGIVLLVLAWTCWRKRKGRGEKIPPPPPRDMTYSSTMRSRSMSNNMLATGGSHINRAGSYSGLMYAGRPSSTYASHSRQPSGYYTSYPIATPPSTGDSPPMPPVNTDSPPFSITPPGDATPPGITTPPTKPVLAINTSLNGDDSSSSNGEGSVPGGRRMPSIDRLRAGAGMVGDRAPSPSSSSHFPTADPSEAESSSRATSPQPSNHSPRPSYGFPPSPPRAPGMHGGYPRPLSMNSLSSSRYIHFGPAGGAPHQGRPIQLEMPKLLGPGGEGQRGYGRPESSYGEFGAMRGSQPRTWSDRDYASDFAPGHQRVPSSYSMSNRSMLSDRGRRPSEPRLNAFGPVSTSTASGASGASDPPSRADSEGQYRTPSSTNPSSREEVADPRAILGREEEEV